MKPHTALDGLDEQQRVVATSFGRPLAVLAPPGSGKTRTVTARIAHGIAIGEIEAPACLALTFTARAAAEVRARLSALGTPPVTARTIHATALRQLRYFWNQTSRDTLPTLISDRESLVAQTRERLHLDDSSVTVRDTSAHIAWAKSAMVAPDDFVSAFEEHGRIALRGNGVRELARVYAEYERTKDDSRLMDFDDVLLYLVGIFVDHPETLKQVHRTYRHVTIDEFQDTSPLQFLLIRHWAGSGRNLCVVGDPDQSIYSFAGAQPHFLRSFATYFSNADVIELTRTYRCSKVIVAAARQLGDEGSTMRAIDHEDESADVVEIVSEDEFSETNAVVTRVQQLLAQGVSPESIAVLTRQQDRADVLADALRHADIPVLMRGMTGFFMRPEVKRALLDLRAEYAQMSVVEAVTAVITRDGWTPEQTANQPFWDSYAVLLRLAQTLAQQDSGVRAEDMLLEVHQRAETLELPAPPAVSVLTMHAAKGLEWDAVIVTGLVESVMPHAYAETPAAIDEERRLLFVAMTRARTHLSLTWFRTRGGEPCQRSRFLSAGVRRVLDNSMSASPAALD